MIFYTLNSLPFMFFIENFIQSLYCRIYNIEIFFLNTILIFIYFMIKYYKLYKNIEINKKDKLYKKYKGIIILHVILSYIISISLCMFFVSFIYYDNNILWNILFAPFISVSIATFFDNIILRKIENKLYIDFREKEYKKYKKSLEKIIKAQQTQQKMLSIHNHELDELKKNINIVEEMIHLDDNIEEDSDKI